MSFFHLRTPAGSVWPAVPASEGSQIWAAYQELDRTQWLSPDSLEEYQLTQLNALLRHCHEQVPYYRRAFDAAGLKPRTGVSLAEFRLLPLLTREAYQANAGELRARQLPAGAVPMAGAFTSGTNGVPIQVGKTSRDALWWNALFLRDLEWSGLDPRGRLASIRLMAMSREELPKWLAGISFPFWTQFLHSLVETGPAHVMDIRQDPRRQLAWLREIRPDYLASLPSNLEFLAGLLAESGEKLDGLRAIQSVGESLAPAVQQRIEDGFGVPVRNLYSTTETGYLASPCPLGHGLHVHAENVFAEVLDESDRPCLPGETGRLVLTCLHSLLTPFLRYDILDDVTLGAGPCPCGRGLPLWTRVEGRRHPLLRLPNGSRKSVAGIVLGVRQVGGVHQFQFIQRTVDHALLRIVPDRSWRPETAERMRQVIQAEFEAPIRVDIEPRDCLERPAGGKLKLAIVEIE